MEGHFGALASNDVASRPIYPAHTSKIVAFG
jgi:hypothetical protein